MMNLGAFGFVMAIEGKKGASTDIKDCNGLGIKHPLIGFSIAIIMLSLIGIPPLAGFTAKYYLFNNALKNGFLWLTIIALINRVISAYYYLRVLVHIYMIDPEKTSEDTILSNNPKIMAILMMIGLILVGVFPGLMLFLGDSFK